jgi:hypothetical protein
MKLEEKYSVFEGIENYKIDDVDTEAYLLKAKIVELEKQPLLASGSETTFVSRQRHDEHVPQPTDAYATIDELHSVRAKGL